MRSEELDWVGCREAVTADRIREVEDRLGITFPAEFVAIVLRCHGGCPGNVAFRYEEPDDARQISDSLGYFFTFREPVDPQTKLRLSWEPEAWRELGIDRSDSILDFVHDRPDGLEPGLVPFTDTGSGDLLCFDYRQDAHVANPPVVLWRHEFVDDQPVVAIAGSFVELIAGLERY